MSFLSHSIYKTLRHGKGRDALIIGRHPSPTSGRLLIIYGGHRVPVDGYHHRFRGIGEELAASGHCAVIHSSDPLGSSTDLKNVIAYALKHARELTGRDDPEISLAGHSAGATAVARVATSFPVSRLLLVAPSKAVDLKDYKGHLVCFAGSKDTDCLENSEQIRKTATQSASCEVVTVPGADHLFHTDATNVEYVQSFLSVGGMEQNFHQGRRVIRTTLPSGAAMSVHPSRSDRILVLFGAKDKPIDGWNKRYYKLARDCARAHEAAVIQIQHDSAGEQALTEGLAYVKNHLPEICGQTSPEIALVGHGSGANVAASVAAHSDIDRLLLIAPTAAPDLKGFHGALVIMAGEDDPTALQHGQLLHNGATSARERHFEIVPRSDRKFHSPDGNAAFLKGIHDLLDLGGARPVPQLTPQLIRALG